MAGRNEKNLNQLQGETNKKLRELNKTVCCLVEAIGNIDPEIEALLQQILETLQRQDELIKIDFCENGSYTGSVIKVWDEDTNTFGPDIYLDSTGTVVTTAPSGETCAPKIDYEYKFIETEKCIDDGNCTKIKEVVCIVFEDGVQTNASTFWIVNGVQVTTDPGAVNCEICNCNPSQESFTGNNATLTEFNEYTVFIPKCCEVIITTSMGSITLPAQQTPYVYSQKIECMLSNYVIQADCVNEITTILTKTF